MNKLLYTIGLKNFIMKIRERIYFKEVYDHKKYGTIIISSNDFTVKDDLTSYHEYYLNRKKAI